MAIEKPRGCGYRKVGGLYICTEPGVLDYCDRIPFELELCPTCGAGIKFSRSITWIDWNKYAGDHGRKANCIDNQECAVCFPSIQHQPYGILWVGERYYTPDDFVREALHMGTSRRIPVAGKIPTGPSKLELDKTWLLFAYKNYFVYSGIIYAAKAAKMEYLIWEKDADPEYLESLKKKNIDPVVIPDGDTDHDPTTPLVTDESVQEQARNSAFFGNLRNRIKKTGTK